MINITKYSNGRASNFEHKLTSNARGTEHECLKIFASKVQRHPLISS